MRLVFSVQLSTIVPNASAGDSRYYKKRLKHAYSVVIVGKICNFAAVFGI